MNEISDKIFLAIMIITMNIGSRHIVKEIPNNVNKIFENKMARLFVIFSMIFVTTRDFKVSLLMMLIFVLFFSYLLNENSKNCLIK